VEILHGYPIDAVVLTTGCDKTTPAQMMAAATVDIPAIVLSGGPMLDGWIEGELVGSGAAIWKGRRQLAAGEIDNGNSCRSPPLGAVGHCNTMGTASTMNALAEALGMSLTGCSAIPAPYRERGQMAYETGRASSAWRTRTCARPASSRARPSSTPSWSTRPSAAPPTPSRTSWPWRAMPAWMHSEDWMAHGYDVPLLLNMQPAGKYLGERFHAPAACRPSCGSSRRACCARTA
jgi:dihydroxy-acid dehydratase